MSIGKSGMMQVEHLKLKSTYPHLKNVYENCVLACRFCNQNRGRKPHGRADGVSLLDPTQVAWSTHFEIQGDSLHDKTPNGEYTRKSYKINDVSRVERRRTRFEAIQPTVDRLSELQDVLLALRRETRGQTEESRQRMASVRQSIQELRHQLAALKERYQWVPQRPPKRCHCGTKEHHSLPPNLLDQAQ